MATSSTMQQQQQQQQQVQPPVWFELSQLDPQQAMYDIRYFSKNFGGMKDLDFKNTFDARFYAQHYTPEGYFVRPTIIGYIPAPPPLNANSEYVINKIIGHEGHWLKETTQRCGVHFIWFERNMNNFLFWAPDKYSIAKAMKAIRYRILKYQDLKKPVEEEYDDDEDDYADMPALISQEECDRLNRVENDDIWKYDIVLMIYWFQNESNAQKMKKK